MRLLPSLVSALLLIPACSSNSVEQTALARGAKQDSQGSVAGQESTQKAIPPTALFPVLKVVDGDTLHIQRAGEKDKLRLLSVDTEERLTGRAPSSTSKPETAFGESCALWAQKFFQDLAAEGATPMIGLRFPDGAEERDIYGRLLCHVILPDGRDFNLMLVQLGKSPYFNKYGNSRICHEDFVRAQREARAAQLGIWDPAVNQPETPGAPAARRPYDALLPWWQSRADAIDDFRARSAGSGRVALHAESADGLEKAILAAEADAEAAQCEVFGSIYRIFDENDGSRTILMRATDSKRALRVRIPGEQLAAHEALDLEGAQAEFRQNYLYVTGVLERDGNSFQMSSNDPGQWRRAAPEPVIPGERKE